MSPSLRLRCCLYVYIMLGSACIANLIEGGLPDDRTPVVVEAVSRRGSGALLRSAPEFFCFVFFPLRVRKRERRKKKKTSLLLSRGRKKRGTFPSRRPSWRARRPPAPARRAVCARRRRACRWPRRPSPLPTSPPLVQALTRTRRCQGRWPPPDSPPNGSRASRTRAAAVRWCPRPAPASRRHRFRAAALPRTMRWDR